MRDLLGPERKSGRAEVPQAALQPRVPRLLHPALAGKDELLPDVPSGDEDRRSGI